MLHYRNIIAETRMSSGVWELSISARMGAFTLVGYERKKITDITCQEVNYADDIFYNYSSASGH